MDRNPATEAIHIDLIDIPERHRPLDMEAVKVLAASMAIFPPTATPPKNGRAATKLATLFLAAFVIKLASLEDLVS